MDRIGDNTKFYDEGGGVIRSHSGVHVATVEVVNLTTFQASVVMALLLLSLNSYQGSFDYPDPRPAPAPDDQGSKH